MVDRFTLGGLLAWSFDVDLWHRTATPKQRTDRAGLMRFLDGAVDVVAYLGEACKQTIDELLRFTTAQIGALCQPECTDAVDNTEHRRFGQTPFFFVDLFDGYAEQLCSGGCVDILVLMEGLHQICVAGDVCQYPQFDLRVVGCNQYVPWCCDKGPADFAPFFGACGDVLQVGVVRAQSSRGCAELVVGSVDPMTAVDEVRQRIYVGRFELAQLTVLQNERNHQRGIAGTELLENVGSE